MKILMFHVDSFWFCPDEQIDAKWTNFDESLLVWIQAEAQDEADQTGVIRKMVKNIRWLSKKHGLKQIILHSFAHLGESKSAPEFADGIIEETAARLRERAFDIHIVPFGGFHEFKMHVKSC